MSSRSPAGQRGVARNAPRRGAIVRTLAIYAVLLAGAAVTLGPFVLSFATSFKTPGQFAREPALSLPSPFTLENYETLFGARIDFVRAIAITFLVVLIVTIGQLTFSVLAAYAFARVRFPGREALFWIYLATLMVPAIVTLIPLYLLLTETGLRNTFWALVLPFVFGSPYAIFLLREYFRGIPQELIDAARLDGAGTLVTLVDVVVPLARPILATLTLITVVTHWNNFLWPLIITSGNTWRVVTVATANLQSQYNGNWTLVMAATTLATAPLLALFLIFQKHIVRSISIGAFR